MRTIKLNEVVSVPCYTAEENPHRPHRTFREDSWDEGNMAVHLRGCEDCGVMYAVEFFNGR